MAQTNTADKKIQAGCEVGFKTDSALDLQCRERLIQARIGLLILHPFYGNLALRLQLVNADAWCPTAATNGKNFFYNTKFIERLSDGELLFLFGHELLHVVYDHLGRNDGRNAMLANIAADYCVNGDLVQNKVGTPIQVVPILHETKYYGWSFERVYDDLYDQVEKKYVDMDDLMDKILDEHLDEDGSGQGDANGEQELDENGNPVSKSKPKMTEKERRALKDEMKEAVLNAAQAAGGAQAGNMPAGIKRLIEQWTQPKMDWRELLQQQIQSTIKNDFTFMKPNRRSWHMDAVLPGMDFDEKIDISLCIDMSGSISNTMIKDFFSEVKGITDMYEDYTIKLWTFDTAVYGYKVFDPTNIDELMDYEPMGGGGTDFDVNWEFMKENEIEPKKFIMFTDGYPWGSWGDENYCDTVFIIHGDKSIKAPFGITAHYEEAA
jgi:predicted metal-dependent peptidase